jgi:anti-sigma B factor antagonist
MSSEYRSDGEKVYIRFKGDIDLTTMHDLKELLFSLTGSGVDIELDASEVEFLDSSGIGMLMLVKKMQKEDGKNLYIVNINERVRNSLSVGISELLFN